MGIDADLAGTARVRMTGSGQPRINGTIRALNGTYAAYGQNLSIERAVMTFSGPYDNPSLDILAVRKRPEGEQLSETNVEAGVQVRGTAQSPTAALVSTPNVSDSDKLSWLVLGQGMEAASGDQKGVLTAAAGALLGGSGGTGGIQSKIANSLGVDELGLKQGAGGGNGSGLESTVVTVGKRISSARLPELRARHQHRIEPGAPALQAHAAYLAAVPDRDQQRARYSLFVGV